MALPLFSNSAELDKIGKQKWIQVFSVSEKSEVHFGNYRSKVTLSWFSISRNTRVEERKSGSRFSHFGKQEKRQLFFFFFLFWKTMLEGCKS